MSNDEIRELVLERGLSDRELGELLGIKPESAARRRHRAGVIRGAAGVDRGRKTPEQIARMGELLDEGLSYAAVGEVLGVDKETVARHYPGRGWSREQTMAHAAASRHGYAKIDRVWGRVGA